MSYKGIILDEATILPIIWWECPSCHAKAKTQKPLEIPFHPCRALGGVSAPFVKLIGNETELDPMRVRHVKKDREDYEGNEICTKDENGRPVMAIVTERADGSNDCAAFAGHARWSKEEQ